MANVIAITAGIGTGPTPLSAFDHALFEAGIGNDNLVHLSSVIPYGFVPKVQKVDRNDIEKGHRLYVVYASHIASEPGMMVASGLGWVMAQTDPAWGLFVEHIGDTSDDVRRQIADSLGSMIRYRCDDAWGEIESHVLSATCNGDPVCALVAAVYQSTGWVQGLPKNRMFPAVR